MTTARWSRAAAALRRLPPRFRTDPVTAAETRALLRCGEPGVAELEAAGLAIGHDQDGSPLFDRYEVLSLGLHSGTGRSLPELGTAFVARMHRLPATDLTGPRAWSVSVTAAFPPCGRCRGRECRVRYADIAVPASAGWARRHQPDPPGPAGLRRVTLEADVVLTGRAAAVRNTAAREAFRVVVEEFRYQFLPPAAQAATEVLRDLHVVDCVGAAHLLVEWLRPQGVPARVRYGLLMFPLGSGAHAWAEITDDDGATRVLDPTMLTMAPGEPGSALSALACGSPLNVVLPLADVPVADRVAVHACGCCGSGTALTISAVPGATDPTG